jgi:glutathione S-transferase
MITVYHVPNSRSLRVVWLMEELGEEYRIERVSIPLSDEFRALAPLCTVPAIEDAEDGQSIRMCESLAILQYITGRRLVAGVEAAANLTVGPRPDPAHYAEHLQWLHFGEADLATPAGTIFRTRVIKGEQTNKTIEDQLGQIGRRLALLDGHLSDGREWVTGEKFTIADISIGYAFVLAGFAKLEVELPSGVAAYWDRLQARPAYQRAAAK